MNGNSIQEYMLLKMLLTLPCLLYKTAIFWTNHWTRMTIYAVSQTLKLTHQPLEMRFLHLKIILCNHMQCGRCWINAIKKKVKQKVKKIANNLMQMRSLYSELMSLDELSFLLLGEDSGKSHVWPVQEWQIDTVITISNQQAKLPRYKILT